jgi:hypothetical protein
MDDLDDSPRPLKWLVLCVAIGPLLSGIYYSIKNTLREERLTPQEATADAGAKEERPPPPSRQANPEHAR